MRTGGDSSIRDKWAMGGSWETSLLLSGTTTIPPKRRLLLDLEKNTFQSPRLSLCLHFSSIVNHPQRVQKSSEYLNPRQRNSELCM